MCHTPMAAMTMNHSTMIGPKNLPMPAVPRFCTQNSTNRMASVSGITALRNAGETTSSPSTADSTVMAGVMTPSP